LLPLSSVLHLESRSQRPAVFLGRPPHGGGGWGWGGDFGLGGDGTFGTVAVVVAAKVRNAEVFARAKFKVFHLGPLEEEVDAFFDAGEFGAFVGSDEGVGDAFAAHAAGAADAMDVVVAEAGDVVVDDVGNARNVDAAADDVGGDEDFDPAAAEVGHHAIAAALVHVAMHALDAVDFLAQPLIDFFGAAFGAAEDDCLARFFAGEQAEQQVELSLRVDGEIKLLDRFDGDVFRREVDRLGVAHVALGQLGDRRRDGGAEEERLSIGGAALEDSFDIGAEADVEHAIGFVEDDERQPREIDGTAGEVVEDAAGRADDDVDAAAKFFNLLTDGFATVDGDAMDAAALGELDDFVLHLDGQFPRGHHHQRLRVVTVFFEAKLFENGDREGGGFSRAGAGLANDVDFFERKGDEAGLDRRGVLVSGLFQGVEHDVGEAEAFEGGLRWWAIGQNGPFDSAVAASCCGLLVYVKISAKGRGVNLLCKWLLRAKIGRE
jgi:hypothetical protein